MIKVNLFISQGFYTLKNDRPHDLRMGVNYIKGPGSGDGVCPDGSHTPFCTWKAGGFGHTDKK